ncbi:MAG TPA: glycosyltransferase family 4 protein, partial [Candidatus Baltobacteraceae bacterium]|nr:glycosyltransferase family 4 protein [Candidatus Baltobacteraceae bacterium]
LAQALRDLGHDVAALRIAPKAPPVGEKWRKYRDIPLEETVEGIPVRTLRAWFPPRMIAMEHLDLQVRRKIDREIRRFRPDVVNAHFLIPNGQIAARHRSVPSVVTAHGSDAYAWPNRRAGLRRAAHAAIAGADAVTAVSEYIAGCVRSIHDRSVEVIWNGADERFFFPRERAAARAAANIPQERLTIAFAGNLLRAKGLFDLIDAARGLRDLRPLLVLAGAGSDREAIASAARERDVDLEFRGRLEPANVGELFGAADIVTLPSHNEGLPSVVCEAMLNGSAIVASTAGGTPEIVSDGKTGLLVPPRDVNALTSALRTAAENAQLRAQLGEHARAFALQNLTWRVSAQGYERVFRRVAGASG